MSGEDGELVRRARAAETREEALRALYERYKDEVYGFLRHVLHDDALAEDAWHEAFVRVCASIETCDPDRSFRAWLYGITRNAAFELLRQRKKEGRLLDARAAITEAPESDPVVADAERQEAAAIARAALLDLPEDARALLVQRHGLGMKLEELAESWGCSERTVRNRLGVAAALLARKLSSLVTREGG